MTRFRSSNTVGERRLRTPAAWVGGGLAIGMLAGSALLAPAAPTGSIPAATPRLDAPDTISVVGDGRDVAAAGLAPTGTWSVGAAKVSIAPAPPAGETWQTTGCFEIEQGNPDIDHALPAPGHGWPLSTPNCIYLGGFGIGPSRAATSVDDGGVYVRSIAVSNGYKTFVYSVIDAVGYFYRYQGSACADCGIYDIRKTISRARKIPEAHIVLMNTHTHSGPDGYGGWGGMPPWYWRQLRDAFVKASTDAVDALTPATINVGSTVIRQHNNERRDTYFSSPDYQAVWLQAKRRSDQTVIATFANYAAHPTILGSGNLTMHADWPGATARRFETLYGGTGLLFEGGLGNMSVSTTGSGSDDARAEATGISIADAIAPDVAKNASRLVDRTMTADIRAFSHPVMTNAGLAALGSLGLFSREFAPGTPGADGPGQYRWSKASALSPGAIQGCTTASALQIKTLAGAHKIGDFGIAFGPGEIFSNLTAVVKSKLRNNKAMAVFGQANDALGYIMQSFEYDYEGGGAAGEYGTQHGEYEEVFAIDHCLGDHVLQTMLDAGAAVGL